MTGTQRRPGVTLMEVLIAIMILSIGLLAIMALFPIGAVNMARAITQDRATTHGVNSDSTFRYYWAQAWSDRAGGIRASSDEAYLYSQEPMIALLQNHANPLYGQVKPTDSQPSFPVLVDPVGWQTNVPGSQQQYFVAGLPTLPMRTTLRRCFAYTPPPYAALSPPYNPYYAPQDQAPLPLGPGPLGPALLVPAPVPQPVPPYQSDIKTVIRLTTLLDDMTFATANDLANNPPYVQGEPATPAAQIERGGRYNVSWLIKRQRNDKPDEVVVKVLVFAGRSPTDTPSPETPYPLVAPALPGEKLIQLDITNQAMPNLRRGAWIALCRPIPVLDPNTGLPAGTPYPSIEFYRVAGVNDETPNVLAVEIESPVKSEGPPPPIGQYGGPGQQVFAVVFENLTEVFERGLVTAAGGSGR